jgi:A118 family predicted phage portal protein
MFEKLIAWLKEAFRKMFGLNDVKKVLNIDLALNPKMVNAIDIWDQMYRNEPSWATTEVIPIGLPAAIAAEIARTATLEMVVKVEGGPRAEYLQSQLAPVLEKLREQIEEGCAMGSMIPKPYVDGNNLNTDFMPAGTFYPVSFDGDGMITSVVFVDQRVVGDKYYTRLEYHVFGDVYEIVNMVFRSTSKDTLGSRVSLDAIEDWAGLEDQVIIQNVKAPLFGYFRFPMKNNVDPASPMGVSCYSRAVKLIQQADEQWGRFLWENESANRAIHVEESLFDTVDGKKVLPDKRLYRTLNAAAGSSVDAKKMVDTWSPDMRNDNFLSGLDAILKRIEFNCGLAYGTLSDPSNVDKTAEEIKSSKQRSYATVTDTQKAVKRMIEQLLVAMNTYADLYKLAPAGEYSVTFQFDDSVLINKDAQSTQDSRAVTQGIMSKIEYRMRNYGEDEATARKMLAMVQEEQPKDMFSEQGV